MPTGPMSPAGARAGSSQASPAPRPATACRSKPLRNRGGEPGGCDADGSAAGEGKRRQDAVGGFAGGRRERRLNFRGATVTCDSYRCDDPELGGGWELIDTPGLLRSSDVETTRLILDRLRGEEPILLVAPGVDLDADLADLLPLAAGRLGALAVTFRDRLFPAEAESRLCELSQRTGLPVVAVDARRLDATDRERLFRALGDARPIPAQAGFRFGDLAARPRATFLERPATGPPLALALLLAPAWIAVEAANRLADRFDPWVRSWLAPLAEITARWPQPLAEILSGDYGFVTMGPLLLVWAAPVVVLHALLMGAYKASGLLDRLTVAMNPWLRPFGMTGRELARVAMGFGCNVPAVISTRSSSACSRGVCISAIAFGSACSYQLGATIAVLAAAGRPELVGPYLLYLGATTLAYARLIAPPSARSPFNVLLTEGRAYLTAPRPAAVWREARGVLRQFLRRALPVYLLITAVASLLHWLGALRAGSAVIEPAMAAFRLPPEAGLAVVLASVRKDGILLLAEPGLAEALSAMQLLTAVYLAGVLLPCLVTCLTIAREQGRVFALRLVGRQALAAVGFSALLAWSGAWL